MTKRALVSSARLCSSTKTEPRRRLRARLKDASLTACQARAASGTLCFLPDEFKGNKSLAEVTQEEKKRH